MEPWVWRIRANGGLACMAYCGYISEIIFKNLVQTMSRLTSFYEKFHLEGHEPTHFLAFLFSSCWNFSITLIPYWIIQTERSMLLISIVVLTNAASVRIKRSSREREREFLSYISENTCPANIRNSNLLEYYRLVNSVQNNSLMVNLITLDELTNTESPIRVWTYVL